MDTTSKSSPFPDDFGLSSSLPLSRREFGEIRDLVHAHFGIFLADRKQGLVVSRLQKHLRQKGFASFAQYIAHVRDDTSGRALSDLANRITTNHTFFYREEAHFAFLTETALPDMAALCQKRKEKELRVWCAGCATGEEAYTLAILLREFFGREYLLWNVSVLATDISQQALDFAMAGVYPGERIRRLPAEWRERYFRPLSGNRGEIDPRLRKDVTFQRLNLVDASYPFRQPFHILFCRNVMIYFERATREALVGRFFLHTLPGGYLFVGHSEALGRGSCPYEYVRPAVYRRREQEPASG